MKIDDFIKGTLGNTIMKSMVFSIFCIQISTSLRRPFSKLRQRLQKSFKIRNTCPSNPLQTKYEVLKLTATSRTSSLVTPENVTKMSQIKGFLTSSAEVNHVPNSISEILQFFYMYR